MSDLGFEPIRGLPERLPEGETLLWQGAPAWEPMARHVLQVRKLAVYFGLLMVWNAGTTLAAGKPLAAAGISALWALGLGVGACGLLLLFAWLVGRSTVYSITSRRVVMRFGIALPMTINLPFALLDRAGLRVHADGTGDMPLSLRKDARVSYVIMWPHARPWRLKRPEPMLRAVPDVQAVARILGRALAASAAQAATAQMAADWMAPDRMASGQMVTDRPGEAAQQSAAVA